MFGDSDDDDMFEDDMYDNENEDMFGDGARANDGVGDIIADDNNEDIFGNIEFDVDSGVACEEDDNNHLVDEADQQIDDIFDAMMHKNDEFADLFDDNASVSDLQGGDRSGASDASGLSNDNALVSDLHGEDVRDEVGDDIDMVEDVFDKYNCLECGADVSYCFLNENENKIDWCSINNVAQIADHFDFDVSILILCA